MENKNIALLIAVASTAGLVYIVNEKLKRNKIDKSVPEMKAGLEKTYGVRYLDIPNTDEAGNKIPGVIVGKIMIFNSELANKNIAISGALFATIATASIISIFNKK